MLAVLYIILSVIGVVILAMLIYTLFGVLRIDIDSDKAYGQFYFGPLVKGMVFWKEDWPVPYARIDVPFYHREFDLLELAVSSESKPIKDKPLNEKKTRSGSNKKGINPFKRLSFKRIVSILKSFKVNAFTWRLDTDDYVLNAQLFPLFYVTSTQGLDVGVNFIGENKIKVDVQNTGFNLLYHFFKPLKS